MSAADRFEDTGRLAEAEWIVGEALIAAAVQVVNNAYGTKPRHAYAPWIEGHRDHRNDCIPCGISALRQALIDLGAPGVLR